MKLVLLPGLDGTGELFKSFIDELHSLMDVDIVIIKYPIEGKQSYRRLSEYVLAHLPDDEFFILGESFAGPIAYEIASLDNPSLKGVIFVATFLKNPKPFLTPWLNQRILNYFLKLTLPDYFIKKWLLGFDADAQLIEQFWHSVRSVPIVVLIERLEAITQLQPFNKPLDIPCSYLRATDDVLVSKDCLEQFKKLCENLREHSIIAPHFLMQAAPRECAKIISQELVRFSGN